MIEDERESSLNFNAIFTDTLLYKTARAVFTVEVFRGLWHQSHLETMFIVFGAMALNKERFAVDEEESRFRSSMP